MKYFEDPIAYDRDVIERALINNTKFSKSEYEDVWKLLKEAVELDLKKGDAPAYYFPHIGTLYIRLKEAAQEFIVAPKKPYTRIPNTQKRFEKVLREVFERTHKWYGGDRRQRKNKLEQIEKLFNLSLEDIEKIQREDNES